MNKKIKLIIALVIFSFFGVLMLAKEVLAIGQMTQPIVIENAIKGQQIVEQLKLYGDSVEKDYGIIAEGDIANWTQFFLPDDVNFETPITSIRIPADDKVSAYAMITIPEDMPNGTYTGEISITSTPLKSEIEGETSASVSQRVGREVNITVIDEEIIDFELSVIPVRYSVDPGKLMEVRIIYYNQGNIAIKPQIQVKVKKLDKSASLYNSIFPYPEDEQAVKPLQRYEIQSIEVPTSNLADGRYWMELTITQGEVSKEEAFRFTVGKVGTVLGASFSEFLKGKLNYSYAAIVAIFAIFIVLLIRSFGRFQTENAGSVKRSNGNRRNGRKRR